MNNPLLELDGLPPFSRIRPEHVEPAIDRLLAEAASHGADVEHIHLRDYPIEFCRNCRECMQQPGEAPGKCVLGTVPVKEDGSAWFRAPAGVIVFFQALDENPVRLIFLAVGPEGAVTAGGGVDHDIPQPFIHGRVAYHAGAGKATLNDTAGAIVLGEATYPLITDCQR